MEKYSQFRDRGSGIAPFFPVPTKPSGIALPFHIFLFVVRVPLIITALFFWVTVVSWLPPWIKKSYLWVFFGIAGIWWIDLQVDGVKRGNISRHSDRMPGPRSIIASSYTSPLDVLYLATIFDPVFTISWPSTQKVQRISFLQALLQPFLWPSTQPPPNTQLTDLETLLKENADTCIAVFPECTTSNGRGILPFSPSLLSTPSSTKIFPVSLRYTPADVATPVANSFFHFMWVLCSKPTHAIRTRIADAVYNTSTAKTNGLRPPVRPNTIDTNFFDGLDLGSSSAETLLGSENEDGLSEQQRKVVERIGEDLARMGRVKRVALGVKEKDEFLKAWTRRRT